jgi:hypothetical protein
MNLNYYKIWILKFVALHMCPKYSAGNCALRDLEIGIEHGVVGCGSKVFNSSNSGDYVIINAKKIK